MADDERWRPYGGLAIVLRGPPPLLDRAAAFFGPEPWTAGAPATTSTMVVTLSAAGDEVRCAGDEILAGDFVGAPDKVFAELEARVLIAALARLPHAALHAAVVAWPDRTWLLAAEHAVGKTTTALAIGLAASDATVVGDDVAILDARGATSFPRPLRLRRPTVDLLALDDVAATSLWDPADEVFRVAPTALTEGRELPETPLPVSDVLLLSRARAGIASAPTAASLPALLRHRFETALDPASTLAAITSLVADARVWTVGVDRRPPALAELILKELAT